MKKNKPGKNKILKRAFYRGRAKKFKKVICLMMVFGIIASALSLFQCAYTEYAVSNAHVILNYPEISESQYPDGSRFTYYDLTCDENLAAALDIMHAEGKYLNYTVDDIRNQFYIYSYLKGSAGASVSSARSAGNDFSYVANEYKITFMQPLDYNDGDIMSHFSSEDLSGEFLEALIEVNRRKIADMLGGSNGFDILTAPIQDANYDYNEKVSIYKTRIRNIIAYIEDLEKQQPDFVSEKHDMMLNDLIGCYSFLISNSLDGISDFVESSGLSQDTNQVANKLKVNIENTQLKYKKALSRVKFNDFAMKNYDQTFTENLINVIQNTEYGLYQARPKTAFDTVAKQKYSASENVAEYGTTINIFSKELANFQNTASAPEEALRLKEKCSFLLDTFVQEYTQLTDTAREIVQDYYDSYNESYISAKITPHNLISKSLIVKMGVAFGLGAALAFVLAVFVSSLNDKRRIKRNKNKLRKIKHSSFAEEA